MPWPKEELIFSASQWPTPSCKLCLLTTLHSSERHERPKEEPEHPWLDCVTHCWHTACTETATLGLDSCSLDFQLAIGIAPIPSGASHQPPGSCQCSSRCTGCPRCAQPAGPPRWHWPGTANTREDTWQGLAFGTALHSSLCSQHHVCFLWSTLMLNCHHHGHS